ncbi:glycoside hydrolase family 43 protein [Xylariaceae sp. FL0594]|nr:glycoside hydrolase family 43 protein [Xylariaceae sp. FL0594]
MKAFALALGAAGLALGLPADVSVKKKSSFPVLGLANITRIGAASDIHQGRRSLSGPRLDVDFPDPSIIYGDGSWKAYATSSNGKRIPVATSSDKSSWTLTDVDALPDPGSWVDTNDGIWAPDVQKNDAGVYVMYYTAHKKGGSHCIGAATSSKALGPFQPQSEPLICDDAGGGVIDASGYDDGVDRWIAWKVDGNSLGGATTCQGGTPSGSSYRPTPIKVQRMARDALTLLGSSTTVLDNEGRSNDGVTEAPALYKIGAGNFVLFYSAHCYSSDDYDIEYAFASAITGPYTNRGILLRTVDNTGIFAPGGIDVDPDGKSVVFHGRTRANDGSGPRLLYSAELTIRSDHSISY